MASADTARHEVADLSKQAASPATTILQMNINAHNNNKKKLNNRPSLGRGKDRARTSDDMRHGGQRGLP